MIVSALPLTSPLLHAGAMTDGSVGAVQTLSGNFTIPQTLGQISGTNLFHSFQSFSINAGESATFTATSALQNVISRVTGGTASNINGMLRLAPAAGSSPNFFFINPAGVTFGAGAAVDVPAGFHVSTANYLKFPDGNFYADTATASTFSSAPPEAFGFLGTTRATSTINGGATLSTQPSQPISIVGGDILIDNGAMSSQGGDTLVVAMGQNAGEVGLAGMPPAAYGSLSIMNGGYIDTTGAYFNNGGNIFLSAGNIHIDNAYIFSDAQSGTGDAGNVTMLATGDLSMVNGGYITADTYTSGIGGAVEVSAANITIDRQVGGWTGISSDAVSAGNAGSVSVTATGTLSVLNGGQVGSNTYSSGDAGSVTVNAGTITIDRKGNSKFTGIVSSANTGSTGNAGIVSVTATGNLSVLDGGAISSDTYSSGGAGWVMVNAGAITVDGLGNSGFTGIASSANTGSTGDAGFVMVVATGNLSVLDGGEIVSNAFASGDAGYVAVDAGTITVDSRGNSGFTGIASNAGIGSTGNAGFVTVMATRNLSVLDGGQIASDTYSSGDAGYVMVDAGEIVIDSQGGDWTGISSDALPGSAGNAGLVSVTSTGALSILNSGQVGSNTYSSGNAGSVTVNAGTITIDGMGNSNFTGIASSAATGSTGNAGFISVTATGTLSVFNGGEIGSNTFSSGDAGSVTVDAGTITIDGMGNGSFTGIASTTNPGSTGNAGFVSVTATGNLSVLNGGEIGSNTFSSGDAGYVMVDAGTITIDGLGNSGFTGIASNAETRSTGNAGFVSVMATGNLSMLNGGAISSATNSSGDAGWVTINAGAIIIDGQGGEWTGISTGATSESTGNAGSVSVTAAKNLSVLNGGTISSTTSGTGSAGSVYVSGNTILVDGSSNATASSIEASATTGSSGQTGSVVVAALGNITLSNGGKLAIQNDATVADPAILVPTMLTATAPSLTLQGAQITAASTGNVAASDIQVSYTDRFVVDPSAIATSAVNGNGGSIAILGAGPLTLDRSQITSSVLGVLNGNGGNITISVPFLLLNTGFIQANTLAATATGGTVSINVNSLLSSGSALFQGGALLAFNPGLSNFNVIQASAPNGVNGVIQISSPQVDLSSSLAGLSTQIVNFGNLGMDICRCGAGSSLTPVGKGGLPPTSSDLLRPGL